MTLSLLAHLIDTSIQESCFPCSMKHVTVRPIYKKGSKDLCDNYQRRSLISTFSKVFVNFSLQAILILRRKPHNSSMQLYKGQVHSWCYKFCNLLFDEESRFWGSFGHVLRFTKAFDMVDLEQLSRFGIRDLSHSRISSYL